MLKAATHIFIGASWRLYHAVEGEAHENNNFAH
jgi:hypothetical protein